jgi:tight adherence protein C
MVSIALLSALIVGIGVSLAWFGLLMSRQRESVTARLTGYTVRPVTLEELELAQPFMDRTIRPLLRAIARFMLARTPHNTLEQYRLRLQYAGNPMALNDFLGLKGFGAVILGLGLGVIMLLGRQPPLYVIVAFAAGASAGFVLPDMWVRQRIDSRRHQIERALPDVLDLLTVSVEAGLGFEGAIQKVVDKWQNPLTEEFARVLAESRIGRHRREALRDMAARCNVPDLTSFVAAVIQADQLGVPIARILRVQSEQMRQQRRQRAEKLAREAPIKMTIVMVLLILPVMWMVIFGPMAPRLFRMLGIGG